MVVSINIYKLNGRKYKMSVRIKRSYKTASKDNKEEIKKTVKIEDNNEEIVKKLSKKVKK